MKTDVNVSSPRRLRREDRRSAAIAPQSTPTQLESSSLFTHLPSTLKPWYTLPCLIRSLSLMAEESILILGGGESTATQRFADLN